MFVAEILGAERMNRKRKLYLQNVSGDELVRAEKNALFNSRETHFSRFFAAFLGEESFRHFWCLSGARQIQTVEPTINFQQLF